MDNVLTFISKSGKKVSLDKYELWPGGNYDYGVFTDPDDRWLSDSLGFSGTYSDNYLIQFCPDCWKKYHRIFENTDSDFEEDLSGLCSVAGCKNEATISGFVGAEWFE